MTDLTTLEEKLGRCTGLGDGRDGKKTREGSLQLAAAEDPYEE